MALTHAERQKRYRDKLNTEIERLREVAKKQDATRRDIKKLNERVAKLEAHISHEGATA